MRNATRGIPIFSYICRCIDNLRAYPGVLYYVVIAMEQYFILLGVKKVSHKTRYGGATSTAAVQ